MFRRILTFDFALALRSLRIIGRVVIEDHGERDEMADYLAILKADRIAAGPNVPAHPQFQNSWKVIL